MSNRYRSGKSITSKVRYVESKTSANSKRGKRLHLSGTAVSGDSVSTSGANRKSIGQDSLTQDSLSGTAVGSEGLGVVSSIVADDNLAYALGDGNLVLDGPGYVEENSGPRGISVSELSGIATLPGTAARATIDPYWTSGPPTAVLAATGQTVSVSGWSSSLSAPLPGQVVSLMRTSLTSVGSPGDGSWTIVGYPFEDMSFVKTVPLLPLADSSQWGEWGGAWHEPAVTKTSDGIVSVTGLIRKLGSAASGDTVICTLPEGFRPDQEVLSPVMSNGALGRVRIRTTGVMDWVSVTTDLPVNGYLQLSRLAYPAAGVASWTDIAAAGTSGVPAFASTFSNSGSNVVGYWKDPYGIVWWKGGFLSSASQSTDNTSVVLFNGAALSPSLETHHAASRTSGVWGSVGFGGGGTALRFKNTSTLTAGQVIYLGGLAVPSSDSDTLLTWSTIPLTNSWVSDALRPAPQWANRNGLIILKGFMRNGTIGTVMSGALPEGARPRGSFAGPQGNASVMFATPTNNSWGRMDVQASGGLNPVSGSNTWYAFDGTIYPREQ